MRDSEVIFKEFFEKIKSSRLSLMYNFFYYPPGSVFLGNLYPYSVALALNFFPVILLTHKSKFFSKFIPNPYFSIIDTPTHFRVCVFYGDKQIEDGFYIKDKFILERHIIDYIKSIPFKQVEDGYGKIEWVFRNIENLFRSILAPSSVFAIKELTHEIQ